MKRITFFVAILSVFVLFIAGCDSGKDKTQPRGKYIYDEAGFLSAQSRVSLSSYLWRLDSQSGYEIALVFPKSQMDEDAMALWFNDHGVGKKDIDNGAAVFILPDSSAYVVIGSGSDKVSVTFSKTAGERIFRDFKNDPVLTLLRFTSALGGKINESVGREIGGRLFDAIKNNIDVILLWAAVIALLFFIIQQFDGFQPRDLILPIAVFVILGAFLGISALSSGSSPGNYKTYGMVISAKLDSYVWIEMRQVCTSTGKTTTCYTIPVPHTRYTNDATILSYEMKDYKHQFWSDDSRWAWERQIGEVDSLTIGIENERLYGVSMINDNSGGKTISDGVWILAGKNSSK